MNKLGTIFLVSVLALAGIGASYAGFTDEITIEGTVSVGTVDLNVIDHTGTYVYKIIETHGIIAVDEPIYDNDPAYLLVAWADVTEIDDDAVTIEWNNLFPLEAEQFDYCVKLFLRYDGTIPARLSGGITEYPVDDALDDALEFRFAGWDDQDELIDDLFGYQVHEGDELSIGVCLDVIQDNANQGLSGTYTVLITATQWNEYGLVR